MTVKFTTGDIFDTTMYSIVIPVNCKGQMGAGLAKTFRDKYPLGYMHYHKLCREQSIWGGMDRLPGYCSSDRFYIFFPTKFDVRNTSSIEFIKSGLEALLRQEHILNSLAIPKLGCGLGKLLWEDVRPTIVAFALGLKIPCEIYE